MIGRTLGVGVRVAGRLAGQKLAGQAQPAAGQHSPAATSVPGTAASAAQQAAARTAMPSSQAVRRGIGGFLRPFRRVGGILWLEVTGAFFLLPVLVFSPKLWSAALAYRQTSNHRNFWVTAGVVGVFLYLGVSSFWRARQRARRP